MRFFYVLVFLVALNCFKATPQQKIRLIETFETVDLDKIPENWELDGEGWGVLGDNKWLYTNFGHDYAVSQVTNLKFRDARSGDKMLYCAIGKYSHTYSNWTRRLDYNPGFDTRVKTFWINKDGELTGTKSCEFRFSYLIPSIEGNIYNTADYLKVYLEYSDGSTIDIFSTDKNQKQWINSDVFDLTNYIDELPFRIVFWFHSEMGHKEGVYIDDFYLEYSEVPSLTGLEIPEGNSIIGGEQYNVYWEGNYSGTVNMVLRHGPDENLEWYFNIPTKPGKNSYSINVPQNIPANSDIGYLEIIDSDNFAIRDRSKSLSVFSPAKISVSSTHCGWINNSDGVKVMDFGSVKIGNNSGASLFVTNNGGLPAEISLKSYNNGTGCRECFTITNIQDTKFTIQPGDKKELHLVYSPESEKTEFWNLILQGSSEVIMLKGRGRPASDIRITASSNDFGLVNAGSSSRIKFLFRNYGDKQQKVNVSIKGNNEFKFVADQDRSFILKPLINRGTDRSGLFDKIIELEFNPRQEGLFNAEIEYVASGVVKTFNITGMGNDTSGKKDSNKVLHGNTNGNVNVSKKRLTPGAVIKPNSSSKWYSGDMIDSYWQMQTSMPLVISLLKNGSLIKNLGSVPEGTNNCDYFELPQNLAEGSDYQLMISEYGNNQNYIISDNFRISSVSLNDKITYNTPENKFDYKRTTFLNRTINYDHTVLCNSKNLTLTVYDHQAEDGDIITLILNGKIIIQNYTLTKKPYSIRVSLDPNRKNYLFLLAVNEGRSGPNTVALEIRDDISGHPPIILESTYHSCQGVTLELR